MSNVTSIFSDLKLLFQNMGGFSAASTNFKTQHRKTLSDSEDPVAAEKEFLVSRIRHLYWNNTLTQNAVESFVANLGGLEVIFVDEKGSEIPFWANAWKTFSENISYDGYGNFASLQTMANRTFAVEGDFFARRVNVFEKEFVPFQIEPIFSNNVPINYSEYTEQIYYGIGFKKGKPDYYLVKPWNKDIPAVLKASETWPYGYEVIPADKMIHVWDKKFPEQKRGLPLLTSVVTQVWQHSDLETSTVTKAVNSASFSYTAKQDGTNPDFRPDPLTTIRNGVRDAEEVTGNKKTPVQFYETDAGQVLHGTGMDIQLLQSEGIKTGINEMLERMQKLIAMTLCSASFQVDGNSAEYNYSSMRASLVAIDLKLSLLRKTVFEPQLVMKIVNWWLPAIEIDYPNEVKPKVLLRYPKAVVPNLLEQMKALEIALKNRIYPISKVYDDLDIAPEEFNNEVQQIWEEFTKLKETMGALTNGN